MEDARKLDQNGEGGMEVDQERADPTHILNIQRYQTADDLFEVYIKSTMNECEKIFTSEEGNGKYLDLTQHYSSFLSIKGLDHLNQDPNQQPMQIPRDYLSWLNCFDQILPAIPFAIKFESI